jgi:hypothetical protein
MDCRSRRHRTPSGIPWIPAEVVALPIYSALCEDQNSGPYSINSLARARMTGGIVRPSALAVFMLMISSNVV